MKDSIRSFGRFALIAGLILAFGILLTDHAKAHYPAGWWRFAHLIAIGVAAYLVEFGPRLSSRIHLKPWLSFALAAAALCVGIIWPFFRWR